MEVTERRAARGCSSSDRRNFRARTIPRLQDEFGDSLTVIWSEPPRAARTLPSFFLNGQPVHSGGYLPWEILRPMVAWALALEIGMEELVREAAQALSEKGIEAEDWQAGFLEWLRRCPD
jgi:hypothetical protein